MKRGQQHEQRVGSTAEGRVNEGFGRLDRSVTAAIEDCLVEVLGADVALAFPVCMDTSVALKDPTAYAEILEEMVGEERSERVLSEAGIRLGRLTQESCTANRFNFSAFMTNLRSRYPPDVLLQSR